MHMRRTIAMSEAAGFQAIEIEDQWLPKRAHHHVGLEHMVEKEIMAAKVEEAVRVRRSDDLLIVARTNAVRASNMDDALARAEALSGGRRRPAAALAPQCRGSALHPQTASAGRRCISRAPAAWPISASARRKWRIWAGRSSPIRRRSSSPSTRGPGSSTGKWPPPFASAAHSPEGWRKLQDELHDDIDLETLLDIERRTVEKG